MRLAIVSDTHMPRGARALPDACVEQLESADAILHAGDFSAAEVLEELEEFGVPVHAVHGNVDSPELRRRLPERQVVEFPGARIGMVHDPAGDFEHPLLPPDHRFARHVLYRMGRSTWMARR